MLDFLGFFGSGTTKVSLELFLVEALDAGDEEEANVSLEESFEFPLARGDLADAGAESVEDWRE